MRFFAWLFAIFMLSAPFAQAEPFQLGVEKREYRAPGAALQAGVGTGTAGLRAEVPTMAPVPMNALRISRDTGKPLKGAVFAKSLAQYDVEIIVDESLSMRKRDCPGGASRWEWCGQQLQDLSDQMRPIAPRGFTLTTFAGAFQTYRNATGNDLRELFAYPNFNPGTRLSQPLNARFGSYFANRAPSSKPLLLVVITDGVPHPRMEPYLVARSLINASNHITNAREVTVVFFQIGGTDRVGRWFLEQMDNDLTANGAKYDIVRVVSFEKLQRQGLTQALVSTVSNFAASTAK